MLNSIKKFAKYKATKIEKGWSGDEKYLLEKGQEKLRVSWLRHNGSFEFERKR